MKWEYDWQMHFNPQKCFVMRLTHARHLTRFNYILGDTPLQETDNHPYLTTFNKIATQGAPQMAVDKEANSLSRVYSYYSKFNLRLFYV